MDKRKIALEKMLRPGRRIQNVVDRRSGIDRRDVPAELRGVAEPAGETPASPPDAAVPSNPSAPSAEAPESRSLESNLERRRGPGRRRTDFMRSAEEGEMSQEQFLFVLAIDVFKRVNNKTFPTWTDVLEVIRKLGYRKTMHSELQLGSKAVDWTERADAACGVFKASGEEE